MQHLERDGPLATHRVQHGQVIAARERGRLVGVLTNETLAGRLLEKRERLVEASVPLVHFREAEQRPGQFELLSRLLDEVLAERRLRENIIEKNTIIASGGIATPFPIGFGVRVEGDRNAVIGNVIKNSNAIGIHVDGDDVLVQKNVIKKPRTEGIITIGLSTSMIENVIKTPGTTGIWIAGSASATFSRTLRNTVLNSKGTGVKVDKFFAVLVSNTAKGSVLADLDDSHFAQNHYIANLFPKKSP